MQLSDFVLILFLAGCSLTDLWKREVRLWFLAAFLCPGIVLSVMGGRGVSDVLMALVPGIALTAVSLVSGGAVGAGDGLVLMIAGLFTDLRSVLICGALSSMFSAFAAAVLFLQKKAKKVSVPFVPCLLLGMLVSEAVML